MGQYANTDQSGPISIDLDPDDGEGPHVYQVNYWIGVRTTEATSGITGDCFARDSLGFDAQSTAGSLNGAFVGSVQGVFSFDYVGVAADAGATWHFDIGVFSPGGVLRYDWKICTTLVA